MGVGNAIVRGPMDCFTRNLPITCLERNVPVIEALWKDVFGPIVGTEDFHKKNKKRGNYVRGRVFLYWNSYFLYLPRRETQILTKVTHYSR